MPTMPDAPESGATSPTDALADLILYCAGIPEFVAEFNRLTGCAFRAPKSALDRLIDETTGRDDHDMKMFARFVIEFVLMRLPAVA